MTSEPSTLTPLMKQFWEIKAQAGDALLFFRMGDFYELFGEDAVTASKILGITLTSRDKSKPDPVPMAGVPHHSVQGYIQKLLRAGKKVAIGEQVEDPSEAKGIVRREITRIFTPAVQFDSIESESSYLGTFLPLEESNSATPKWIFSALDPATGESFITPPLPAGELSSIWSCFNVRHLVVLESIPQELLAEIGVSDRILVEKLPTHFINREPALDLLKKTLGLAHLESFFPDIEAAYGLGILVHYTVKLQKLELLAHIKPPRILRKDSTLKLGPRTAQHLDLLPSDDGTPCLFDLINRTKTALGARQLRRWLLEPLANVESIWERQASIQELSTAEPHLKRIQTQLGEVYDLERILGRISTGLANPRDTRALGRSLSTLPGLVQTLAALKATHSQHISKDLIRSNAALQALADKILRIQKEEAPLLSRDGGIFNMGTTPELDELISLTVDGEKKLIEMETREKEATGIQSLKIRYNRVFGYYIEVTKANLKQVPAHYQRKQSTVNAERFFHDELKEFEDKIINASTRLKALELALFEKLIEEIRSQMPEIMEVASTLGQLDGLCALAHLGLMPGWNFPKIDNTTALDIKDGRHPLVDASSNGKFVPNDLQLSPDTRLTLLITGPNMGGKSTIMRQVALIIILGQMGAPVPARAASWGYFASIYTRIGAHDAIARGQSTFMVEMSELAHILHHANERSLVVLDEIGRGTSTYDGMSVAWATLNWICNQIHSRTLFATHYHELTHLFNELPQLANAHMAVEAETKTSGLRFLYKLRPGATNESFGIHVAKLAGIPAPVIHHAWEVLKNLESQNRVSDKTHSHPDQLSLFNMAQAAPATSAEEIAKAEARDKLVQELYDLDLNAFTPLQALNFLAKLREDSIKTSI